MILAESFTKEWIHSHRKRKGFEKINPPLAEKMIHALALVEALAASKLDFVFKGGTSLILLMPSAGRFSIDIDIITQAGRTDIENTLAEICKKQPFTSFKLNEQRSYKPGIPKAHYSLIYTSRLTEKEDHILLDILLDEHSYPSLLELPIAGDWLRTDAQLISVKVPTHESITGDKLTAFAPNTTGVPYKVGKELEIVKQLFDLGRLFHKVESMETVKASFDRTVEKEIIYRGRKCERADVLNDIIQTGLLIAKRERNVSEPYLSNFKEIQKGLLQFKPYQMTSFFRIDEAITASAKAAYMAATIMKGANGPVETFHPGMDKREFLIQDQNYNFLNKLPGEALFYWNKTLRNLSH